MKNTQLSIPNVKGKIRPFFLAIMTLIAINACKKPDHQEFTVPNCILCDFADSLNGNFRGLASGAAVPNQSDSATLTIEHIFMGKNAYEDSTIMFFKTAFKYDFASAPSYDTIQIKKSNGEVDGRNNSPGSEYYIIRPDSIMQYYKDAGPAGSSVVYFQGVFYRQ